MSNIQSFLIASHFFTQWQICTLKYTQFTRTTQVFNHTYTIKNGFGINSNYYKEVNIPSGIKVI